MFRVSAPLRCIVFKILETIESTFIKVNDCVATVRKMFAIVRKTFTIVRNI